MKSNLLLFLILGSLTFFSSLRAQTCGFDGGFATGTGPITTTPGNSNCFDRAFSIGDNITMTGLIIDGEYTVDICGELAPSNHPAPYDSYIGIWTTGGGAFLIESLGGTCGDGNDESVTFTATATSHVAVLRNEACGTGFQLHDLCVTYVGLLPVELIEFSVELSDGNPVLFWRTETEQNNEKFEIERSRDGEKFQSIGEIEGHGTTIEEQQYSFIDKASPIGIVYYRLKQIDYDGQFEYSKIRSINFKGEYENIGDFYPNPTNSGLVNLEYIAQKYDEIIVSVFDLTGKFVTHEIKQVSNGSNSLNFDFSKLSRGVYIMKIGDEGNPTYRKLIIE